MNNNQLNEQLLESYAALDVDRYDVCVNHFYKVIEQIEKQDSNTFSELWLTELQVSCKSTQNSIIHALKTLVTLNSKYLLKQLQELAVKSGQMDACIVNIRKDIAGKRAQISAAQEKIKSDLEKVRFAEELFQLQENAVKSTQNERDSIPIWPVYIPIVNIIYLPVCIYIDNAFATKLLEAKREMELLKKTFEEQQDILHRDRRTVEELCTELTRKEKEKEDNEEQSFSNRQQLQKLSNLQEKLNKKIIEGDKICTRATLMTEISENVFDEDGIILLKQLAVRARSELCGTGLKSIQSLKLNS